MAAMRVPLLNPEKPPLRRSSGASDGRLRLAMAAFEFDAVTVLNLW